MKRPIDIECPRCQARAGNHCTDRAPGYPEDSGLRVGLTYHHGDRVDAAFAASTVPPDELRARFAVAALGGLTAHWGAGNSATRAVELADLAVAACRKESGTPAKLDSARAAPSQLRTDEDGTGNHWTFAGMPGKIVRRVGVTPMEKDRQLPVSCAIEFTDGSFFTLTSDYVWDRATDGSLCTTAAVGDRFVGKKVSRAHHVPVRSSSMFPMLFAIDFEDGDGIVMKSSSAALFMDGATGMHVTAPFPMPEARSLPTPKDSP